MQSLPAKIAPGQDKALGMQSTLHLLHDSGDIYGHIVMIKLINGNSTLAANMAKIAGSDIAFFNIDKQLSLSSFSSNSRCCFSSVRKPLKHLSDRLFVPQHGECLAFRAHGYSCP